MFIATQLILRIRRFLESINSPSISLIEKQLVLQSQLIVNHNRSKESISNLKEVEFKAFSQWGEDGIIDWIISRLPSIEHTFIEFGVSDYRESNTRLLLQLRNWKGLIIDGGEENIASIKKQDVYWRHDLTAKQSFITAENINNTITDAGFSGEVGLLSVDIDGNDYWVWKAITTISPAIVICEYNTALGDIYPLTVPYQPDFQRAQAHHSLLYFGASIQALISLGKQKNYICIGSTSSGCNVFFIRNDLAHHVLDSLEDISVYPCKAREARGKTGEMLYVDGIEGADIISHLPIIDISEGQLTKNVNLASKGNLFSQEWVSGNGGNLENSI